MVTSIVSEVSGLIPEKNFSVVSNPEFLREGSALWDVFFPDRIVVGTNNQIAREIMRNLYNPLVSREKYYQLEKRYSNLNWEGPKKLPIYFETDVKSAEMIKYAANAFLAVKISYINEMAKLCEKLGINVLDVAKGMGLDSRIGGKFLEVSSGWQGSCFPKDTSELYQLSKKYESELSIVKAAIDANFDMHRYVVEKLINFLGCLNGKTIGILGLTFKPNTDDARKTQAEYIIPNLLSLGANVQVFDPQGMEMFKKYNPHLPIKYCVKAEDVAQRADCILLLTHWQEFKKLNWQAIRSHLKILYVLDTRNFLNREELRELGFHYQGLGVIE
ncbi:MAG: UDP-glucose dehydrogenase family protein [Peptococcales bacterium]